MMVLCSEKELNMLYCHYYIWFAFGNKGSASKQVLLIDAKGETVSTIVHKLGMR